MKNRGNRVSTVFWPALTVTLVSAASMALEIVAGRALAPYVGMSLYTWTIIIAVVLAGLSLGNWIGGWLSDRSANPHRIVAMGLLAASLTSLFSLFALRMTAPALQGSNPIESITVLTMAAFFLPSAFAGLLSPLLAVIALARTPDERKGSVLGLMFALGAFGAILGTVLSGLVLIQWVGTGYSVAIIAGMYAALSLLFWRTPGGIAVTAVAGIMLGTALATPDRSGLRSACLEESQYFCIRVDPVPGLARPARVMALDHLAHGMNDRDDPGLLLSSYVQGVDELVGQRFRGSTLDAFFVGGGAYTLPRAWQQRYPDGRFTIAELDPKVSEAAKRDLWYAPGAETTILHGDARQILSSLPKAQRFDVIFGDAFHDISIPQHLVTDEFNQLVANRLNPGGAYVMNVVDAQRRPRFLISLAKTLQARFGQVELWIDPETIQPVETRTTWIILASEVPTPSDRIAAEYGFGRDWLRVPLNAMFDAIGQDRLVFLTDDFAPVDRLLSNVLLDANLAEARGN